MERRLCCAKSVACGRVIERERGNPSKVPPSHSPFLAVGGSADNKTCGQSQKETPSGRMVFSFWNVAGRLELAASTGAKRVESRGPAGLLRMALPFVSVSINPHPCHSEPVTDVTGVGIRNLLAGNLRKSAGIMRFRNGLPHRCVPQGHLLRGAHWLAMTGFFDRLETPSVRMVFLFGMLRAGDRTRVGNSGAFPPFILTVDRLGWVCYLLTAIHSH